MTTLAEEWRQEGYEEAKQIFLQEKGKWTEQAKIENAQETLIDVAGDLYGPLSTSLQDKVKSIQSIDNLRMLTRKVHKTQSLEEFTELVNRAAES